MFVVNIKGRIRNTIFFATDEWVQQAGVFVPGKPFQPNAMFVNKARACLIKHFSGAPLYSRLLALPTNIRIG
jgi:hypothetical protein